MPETWAVDVENEAFKAAIQATVAAVGSRYDIRHNHANSLLAIL
jgi:hypothetical protein